MTEPCWIAWWFRGAAIYGAAILLASTIGTASDLPQVAFLGVAGAFQLVFWIVATDPRRYRPVMLACVFEKLAFGVPALVLDGTPPVAIPAIVDLLLGAGFLIAWRRLAHP